MDSSKSSYIFKVIVVGEGGVGKTTFINRFATNKFAKDTKITIGAGFYSFHNKVDVDADIIIKLQVWDFGGERRFRFILPSYCHGAHAVIFAFDMTRSSSLLNLSDWFDLVYKNTASNPIVLMIGTKADKLGEAGKEAVTDVKIEDFLKKNELSPEIFFKTSSKTGENVENVFAALSDLLYARVIQLNV